MLPSFSSTKSFPISLSPGARETGMMLSLFSPGDSASSSKMSLLSLSNSLTSLKSGRLVSLTWYSPVGKSVKEQLPAASVVVITGLLFSSRMGLPLPSSSSTVTPGRGVSPMSSLLSSEVTLPEILPSCSSTKSFPISLSPGARETGIRLSLFSVGNSASLSSLSVASLSNSLTSLQSGRLLCLTSYSPVGKSVKEQLPSASVVAVIGALFSSRIGSLLPSSNSTVTPSKLVSPMSSLSSSEVTLPEILPSCSSTKSLPISLSPGARETGMMLSLSASAASCSVSRGSIASLSNSLTSLQSGRLVSLT